MSSAAGRQLDEAKKRQAEELEEARRRAREQEQLRRAESEKVKLLRRQRNFGVIVLVLGVIVVIVIAALGYFINEKRKSWKQTAAELEKQRQTHVEKGRSLRENAKADLVNRTDDPTKDVTALRNLAIALNFNRQDDRSRKDGSEFIAAARWCPPAALRGALSARHIVGRDIRSGGSNNEIFAAAGDGQLLFWNGRRTVTRPESLFKKPKPTEQRGRATWASPPLVLMDNGCSLFLRRSLRLQTRRLPAQGLAQQRTGSR